MLAKTLYVRRNIRPPGNDIHEHFATERLTCRAVPLAEAHAVEAADTAAGGGSASSAGPRFSIDSKLLALIAGLLAGCRALRGVERQSLRLGLGRRGGKISDTGLTHLLKALSDDALLPLQVALVKDMKRRGQLKSDGLRLNWTTIDGKYVTLDHHADGMAQKFENKETKAPYWRLGVLRAVQVSAAGRPALGQWAMGPVQTSETDPEKVKHTGEITNRTHSPPTPRAPAHPAQAGRLPRRSALVDGVLQC